MDSDSPASVSVAGRPIAFAKPGTFTFTVTGDCTDRSGLDATRVRRGYRGPSGHRRLPDGEGVPA
ncbi:hypothetical protein ACFQAS_06140 [Halopenitus salinus]|jgi:hypothetical protein|uniref:Uncharacterized protein n=1 Tax=Halopenitus salinus TaxID=1198295 RepID=A0ABD5UV61_9EURY